MAELLDTVAERVRRKPARLDRHVGAVSNVAAAKPQRLVVAGCDDAVVARVVAPCRPGDGGRPGHEPGRAPRGLDNLRLRGAVSRQR